MIRVCLCRGVCPGVGVRITQVPCNCVRRRYGNLAFAAGFLCFRGASTATDTLATLVDPWTLEEGAVLKLPSVSADQGRGDGPTEEGEAASSGNGASSPVDDGDSSDDGAEERAAYSRPTSSHGKKQRRKDKGASAHNHAMPSRLFSDGRRLYLAVQPSPSAPHRMPVRVYSLPLPQDGPGVPPFRRPRHGDAPSVRAHGTVTLRFTRSAGDGNTGGSGSGSGSGNGTGATSKLPTMRCPASLTNPTVRFHTTGRYIVVLRSKEGPHNAFDAATHSAGAFSAQSGHLVQVAPASTPYPTSVCFDGAPDNGNGTVWTYEAAQRRVLPYSHSDVRLRADTPHADSTWLWDAHETGVLAKTVDRSCMYSVTTLAGSMAWPEAPLASDSDDSDEDAAFDAGGDTGDDSGDAPQPRADATGRVVTTAELARYDAGEDTDADLSDESATEDEDEDDGSTNAAVEPVVRNPFVPTVKATPAASEEAVDAEAGVDASIAVPPLAAGAVIMHLVSGLCRQRPLPRADVAGGSTVGGSPRKWLQLCLSLHASSIEAASQLLRDCYSVVSASHALPTRESRRRSQRVSVQLEEAVEASGGSTVASAAVERQRRMSMPSLVRHPPSPALYCAPVAMSDCVCFVSACVCVCVCCPCRARPHRCKALRRRAMRCGW